MQETDFRGKQKSTILSDDPKERRRQILAALDRFDIETTREIRIYWDIMDAKLSET